MHIIPPIETTYQLKTQHRRDTDYVTHVILNDINDCAATAKKTPHRVTFGGVV